MDSRDGATAAADLFRATWGRSPAGVWTAPGRVNLIGEHTDYNQGFVLPFAISQAVYVAASRRDDERITVTGGEPGSTTMTDPGDSTGDTRARYPMAAIEAMRRHGFEVPGIDLAIESDLPAGAGLSSSAAVLCATVQAAAALAGARPDASEVAAIAHRAEAEVIGVPVGVMDHLASMLGAEGHLVFLDCRSLEHRLVPVAGNDTLTLLVVDTRSRHLLADGEYAARRRSCESVAERLGVEALRDLTGEQLDARAAELDEVGLRRARHVITENQRVLRTVAALADEGLGGIGDLLLESHRSLASDFEVSTPRLDLAVDAAVASGALGARMTGAGFGGSVIALVPRGSIAGVVTTVEQAFAERGYEHPHVFEVWPSDGGRRVL